MTEDTNMLYKAIMALAIEMQQITNYMKKVSESLSKIENDGLYIRQSSSY